MDRPPPVPRIAALLMIGVLLSSCSSFVSKTANGCKVEVYVRSQDSGLSSIERTVTGPNGETLLSDEITSRRDIGSDSEAQEMAEREASRLVEEFQTDPRCAEQVTRETVTEPPSTVNPTVLGGIVAAVVGALAAGSPTTTTGTN